MEFQLNQIEKGERKKNSGGHSNTMANPKSIKHHTRQTNMDRKACAISIDIIITLYGIASHTHTIHVHYRNSLNEKKNNSYL